MHCVVLSIVGFGVQYSQRDLPDPNARYSIQLIHLRLSERPFSGFAAIGSQVSEHKETLRGEARRFQPIPRRPVQSGKQTLVRPDVLADLVLNDEVPIPSALLWDQHPLPSPSEFISPPKEITDPTQSLSYPPSFALPNRETTLPDLKMLASALATMPPPAPLRAATAPVRISGPERGDQLPQTTSADSRETTPANLLSISATPLLTESIIVIPPANQVAAADSDAFSFSNCKDCPAGSVAEDAGAGRSATHEARQAAAASGTSRAGSDTEPLGGASLRVADRPSAGDARQQAGLTRIDLPQDGKFDAVVLGSSASELFSESTGLLGRKFVYTVYVRVRLHKSWILQYCLPKDSEPDGSAIEAPWPFLLLRPDRLRAAETDYIIVHGFINPQGRFEQLALAYPEELSEKDLLLGALQQWSFRPAKRKAQAVTVEVLLIIPNEGG